MTIGGVRGLNNHNPFNVKQVSPKDSSGWWFGSTGLDEKGHAVFTSAIYSVRCAVHQLANYQVRDRKKTLAEIFAVYAPSDDPAAVNDPNDYARFVAANCGVHPDTPLTLFNANKKPVDIPLLIKILQAMLQYENFAGCEMPLEGIRSGIWLDQYFREKAV